MNIAYFTSNIKCTSSSYVCNDYVDIHEEYYDISYTDKIIIDLPIYIYGTSVVNTQNSVIIINTISTKGSLSTEFKKLIPGSFIGKKIFDPSNTPLNNLLVNGYKTNIGIIS